MTANLEEAAGEAIDLEEAEEKAATDIVAQREAGLARELQEMRTRKRKLVDPIQFAISISSEDLSDYVPTFDWEKAPASQKQIEYLQDHGSLQMKWPMPGWRLS